MSSRTWGLRAKIAFLLASLAALWAFAAFVTVRDGLSLLWISTLDQAVGRPTNSLVAALQDERRLSAMLIAGGGADRTALDAARRRTDGAAQAYRDSVSTMRVSWAADDTASARIGELGHALDGLRPHRSAVDSQSLDTLGATAFYADAVRAAYQVFETIATFADRDINSRLAYLLTLSRGRELLSQEDALMSGVLVKEKMTSAEAAQFAQLVGAQRFTRTSGTAGLPMDAGIFQPVLSGLEMARLRAVEDRIIAGGFTVDQATWRGAVDAAMSRLNQLDIDLAEATIDQATPAGIAIIVRLVLAGGLGLIAVIASIVLAITTARRIVHQLRLLRDQARDLAVVRLPRVVERLAAGEEVDVAAEAPPLSFGRDEIGQLGQAFNQAQETAVRVAVEQAELRRSVRDIFLNLARRNQELIHGQLRLLDAMELRAADPAELDELFRIDHLATRMRRNAENLIVLSGATPGRQWHDPIPIVDIGRAATAEVEAYTRVVVATGDPSHVIGRAAGDVIHLLAELVENALTFSPPDTVVTVRTARVGTGQVIEVEDRGLGMAESAIEEANEALAAPPEFQLTSTARLGHFVVAKLAGRHGIEVKLRRSEYGGITAVVLIPEVLIAGRLPSAPVESPRSLLSLPPVSLSLSASQPQLVPPAILGPGPDTVDIALPPPVSVPAAVVRTPAGLPVRARTGRDTSMAAFQRGTQRGRDAAAGLAGPASPRSDPPPSEANFSVTQDGAGNASDR